MRAPQVGVLVRWANQVVAGGNIVIRTSTRSDIILHDKLRTSGRVSEQQLRKFRAFNTQFIKKTTNYLILRNVSRIRELSHFTIECTISENKL